MGQKLSVNGPLSNDPFSYIKSPIRFTLLTIDNDLTRPGPLYKQADHNPIRPPLPTPSDHMYSQINLSYQIILCINFQ